MEPTEDMGTVPSDLFPYVFHFLLENKLMKTAKYFKKETQTEPAKPDGPSLLDIFQKYKSVSDVVHDEVIEANNSIGEKKKKKRKLSENIDFNIVTEENTKPKKKRKQDMEIDATEQLNPPETTLPVPDITGEESPKKKKKKKKSEASKPETDTLEETIDQLPSQLKVDDIDTNTNEIPEKKVKKKKKSKKDETNSPDISSGINLEKKEETSVVELSNDDGGAIPSIPSKKLKKSESFRRVKAEEIVVREDLKDNSFEAKFGAQGDWGEKANKDLKFTKGKSFRHEKTKKKRGSYRGGSINTSVNSIRFDDADD